MSISELSKSASDMWTPKKAHSLTKSPTSSRIRALISPNSREELRKGREVLYRFKDTETQERYIGQSSDVAGRLHSQLSECSKRDETTSSLAKAVFDHPERITWGVIRKLEPGEDIDQLETQAIVAKDSIRNGYNTRLGGGGGKAQPKSKKNVDIKKAVETFANHYVSPVKHFFNRDKKGSITHSVPDTERDRIGVIYDIGEETEEGPIHMPGYTSTTLRKRLSSHLSSARHPETPRAQSNSLYKAIHARTRRCWVSVVDTSSISDLDLPAREKVVIKFYKERGNLLRNKNGGGGGGWTKSKRSV